MTPQTEAVKMWHSQEAHLARDLEDAREDVATLQGRLDEARASEVRQRELLDAWRLLGRAAGIDVQP